MPKLCLVKLCSPRRIRTVQLFLITFITSLFFVTLILVQQLTQFLQPRTNLLVTESRCQWPPESSEQLRNPITGTYDITLHPCVQTGGERIKDPCDGDYYKRLMALYQGPAVPNGSCLRRMVLLDSAVRMNQREPNYLLYPQMLDVPAVVKAMKAGQPIETTPINNPELHLLRIPSGVCNPISNASAYSQDLIVLVKSCVDCFEQRNHARQTYMQPKLWTEFNVKFVFVIGMPPVNVSDWVHFDGVRLPNPNRHKSGSVQPEYLKQRLFQEADQYNDLLLGDFIDTYYNLTLKQITTFRWISAFCRHTSALYLFIDNDYSLIPSNTMRMVWNISLPLRLQLNAGTYGPLRYVLRPSKNPIGRRWTVSNDEIPWSTYPQYSSGAAYIVGAELVTDASIAMAFTRFLRFDDAYLGFVWTKLHVPVMIMKGMRHAVKDINDCQQVVSLSTKDADRFVNWETGQLKQHTAKLSSKNKSNGT